MVRFFMLLTCAGLSRNDKHYQCNFDRSERSELSGGIFILKLVLK